MAFEEWTREQFHKGVYEDFVVHGFRYRGPRGETGWHTTSWPNANPIHDFFVMDGEFHQIGGNLFDPQFGYQHSFYLGGSLRSTMPNARPFLRRFEPGRKSDR